MKCDSDCQRLHFVAVDWVLQRNVCKGDSVPLQTLCIKISLTNLVLESKKQKKYFALNEANQANLNADKRISKCMTYIFA